MKHKYKNMEFTLQYYKYDCAPTVAFLVVIDHTIGRNHTYYDIPLTYEQKRELWNIAVCQGKEQARAEVKRIFRRLIKKECAYKRYPFRLENGGIISIQGEYIKTNAELSVKFCSAKRQREAMSSDDWVYVVPIESGSLQVADNKLKMVKDETTSPSMRILKDSQFCQTVYDSHFWDEIRKQQAAHNDKIQKRITFLEKSVQTYGDILNDETGSRIPKSVYPYRHITGCDNWREDYQRSFDAYTQELSRLTA